MKNRVYFNHKTTTGKSATGANGRRNDAQRVSIVTPDYMHQIQAFDNVLVTNGSFNSLYKSKNEFLRNVSPMTDIGMSVALLNISRDKIKGNLDARQIELTKAAIQTVRSWYELRVISGMDEGTKTNPSPLYFLNMAPVTLASLSVDSAMIGRIEAIYAKVIKNDKFAQIFSDGISNDFIRSFETARAGFSSNMMTSVDFFETFAMYLRTSKQLAGLHTLLLEVLAEEIEASAARIKAMTDKGNIAKIDANDKNIGSERIAADFFSREALIMFIDITMRSAITNDKEMFTKIANQLGKVSPAMSSVLKPSDWIEYMVAFVTSLRNPEVTWSKTSLLSAADKEVLTNAYNRILGAEAASAIVSMNESISRIRSFNMSLQNFYADQAAFIDRSFERTPDLIRSHKSLMRDLAVAQDVASARTAISRFTAPDSVFNTSLAGLLYGICIREEDIEKELVSDMMRMAINTDVVRSFMKSAFAEGVVLQSDSMGRLDDYGTGISGYTLKARLDASTKVVFTDDESLEVNSVQMHELGKIFSAPYNVEANKSAFRKYALLAIGSTDIHSDLNGNSEISTFAAEYSYSKAVRDELLPTVRRINNVVGLQIYAYRRASMQWVRHYLHGVNDFCNFGINRLEAEKVHLRPRIYSEVTVENLKKIKELVCGHIKEMFDDEIVDVPSMVVPDVRFYFGKSKKKEEDIDRILDALVDKFRRANERPRRMMDEISSAIRAYNTLAKNGESYKLTDNPLYLKDSSFIGYKSKMNPKEASYNEVTFDRYSALRPTSVDIDVYRKASSRNDKGLHWFQGGILDSMLDMVIKGGTEVSDPQEIVSTRFGLNHPRSFELNPFITKKMRLKAIDALQKVYAAEKYSEIRRNRSQFLLNYACQSILRVSCSPYEGMEYGFSPTAETFLSTSDDMTLQKILGIIGLAADANIKADDTVFLTMVSKIQKAKGPLKLTANGEKLLASGGDKRRAYATRYLLELSENYRLGSAQTATFTIYLRTNDMLNAMYADFLVEDISHNYSITPIEDALIRNLRSSGFDDIILVLSSDAEIPLQSVETDADIINCLEGAGSEMSKVFFPPHSFTSGKVVTKDDTNPSGEEDEGDEPK